MLEKVINKLMSGKFLMTVAFTVTTCYLAWVGKIEAKDFVMLATMIVSAYFGQSVAKGVKNE